MNRKIFINPITDRFIQSTGKTFKDFKKLKNKLYGDRCLYNITSAKQCLKSIFRLYPNIVYYPSNFVNIPSTYPKETNPLAVGFIKKDDDLVGFVDKEGIIKKFKNKIRKRHGIPIITTTNIKEDKALLSSVKEAEESTIEEENKIKIQLTKPPLKKNIQILYNPVQKDFIPLKAEMDLKDKINLLNVINNTLIPKNIIINGRDDSIVGWN